MLNQTKRWSKIERPQQPRLNPVVRVLRRQLPNHVLFVPCAAGIEWAVVPPRVLLSGSGGRDPTDGADPDGAAPGLGVTARIGSRLTGSARRSTTGTTGGRFELQCTLQEDTRRNRYCSLPIVVWLTMRAMSVSAPSPR